ncbi:hypothetical protein K7432_005483 [Basidiobolus ranarum]|uniref:Ribosomal protein S21 n=1 Tax=Basidiobolus ranarum TaxID=34480 RepID=A0ABR2W309_9FUNG
MLINLCKNTLVKLGPVTSSAVNTSRATSAYIQTSGYSSFSSYLSSTEKAEKTKTSAVETPGFEQDFEAGISQGRSVAVHNGNVLQAYRRLNNIIKDNNIRKELRQNEYFERPSVKKHRLAVERNRRLFQRVISKKVALVMQMKNRYVPKSYRFVNILNFLSIFLCTTKQRNVNDFTRITVWITYISKGTLLKYV